MRAVYVQGIAMTHFGRHPEAGLKSMTRTVTAEVLADAGLEAGDLDAAFFANAIGGAIVHQEMVAGQVALSAAGVRGLPIVNVENACASASTALVLGRQAVASGDADRVLCIGVEKMSHADKAWTLAAIGRAVDVEDVFGPDGPQPGGRSYFMDIYAGEAKALMERSGARIEDFAAVAAKNHSNGARNPRAQYGLEMTPEDVMAAREIVWPLTLPMCSPVSDGGAAAVLVSEEHLDPSRPAVRLCAAALVSGADKSTGSASARAARRAYDTAGIGPEDADLVEVHDAAAPAEIAAYEALGLAPVGEGARLVRDGHTALGGRIPVNSSGGLLSKGHPIGATGLAQVHEAVEQLRGEAGARQVVGARVAITHNGGGWLDGDNAAAVVSIFERVTATR